MKNKSVFYKWMFSFVIVFGLSLFGAAIAYACTITSYNFSGCSSSPCSFTSPAAFPVSSRDLTVSGVISDAVCTTCSGNPENEGSIQISLTGTAIAGGSYTFTTANNFLPEGPFTETFSGIPFTGTAGEFSGTVTLRAHGTPPIDQTSISISGNVTSPDCGNLCSPACISTTDEFLVESGFNTSCTDACQCYDSSINSIYETQLEYAAWDVPGTVVGTKFICYGPGTGGFQYSYAVKTCDGRCVTGGLVSCSLGCNPLATGTTACTTTVCGDGLQEGEEQCDDNNEISGDGCSSYCVDENVSVCGNSSIESGEQCDDGGTSNGDGCSSTCQNEASVCGNSSIESGEQCDDGGTTNGDGCSSTCQTESSVCGNSSIESGEQCDDGGTTNGDGCSSTCQNEVCGDGIINDSPNEVCDGSALGGATCSSATGGTLPDGDLSCDNSCALFTSQCSDCGNGIVEGGETCDDANLVNDDACPNSCQISTGGRRRGPSIVDDNGDPTDLPVDGEDPRDEDDGDDPRDETVQCNDLCVEYFKAATRAVNFITNLNLLDFNFYPLNSSGTSTGPVFAGPNTYTIRSLEQRQQAADVYFYAKQQPQYDVIKSNSTCYPECFKTPCLPCKIDTSVLLALRERMGALNGQLSYLEAMKEIPELREEGWNDKNLDQAIKDKETEIASWEPVIERENVFVFGILFRCDDFAKANDTVICEGEENEDSGDDPKDEWPPDSSSCRGCSYFYTAAQMIQKRIYNPHIEMMIEKYKADPSRMYKFNRDGTIKTKEVMVRGDDGKLTPSTGKVPSDEFLRDKKKEEKIRTLMNRLVAEYNACREKFEGDPLCPPQEDFKERPDKCKEICPDTLSSFDAFAENACEDITDENTRKEQNDIKKQIKELTSQLNRTNSRLAQVEAALGQARAQLGAMIAQGQNVQRAEAAVERGQQMADRLEGDAGKLMDQIEQLQNILNALQKKKSRDEMEDEFEDMKKDLEACEECLGNRQKPTSLDKLCPESEEGEEGEDGGGGDGDSADGEGDEDRGGTPPQVGGGQPDQDGDDDGDDSTRADDAGPGADPAPVDPPPAPIPPPPPTEVEMLAAEKLKSQTSGTPEPGTTPTTDAPTPPGGGEGTGTGEGEGTTSDDPATAQQPTATPCPQGSRNHDQTTAELSNIQNRCFVAPPLDLSNPDHVRVYTLVNNVIGAADLEKRGQASGELIDYISSLGDQNQPGKMQDLQNLYQSSGKNFQSCLDAFAASIENECSGPAATSGTGTGTSPSPVSGSQTTTGGPGSQPRTGSPVELLAGQLCKSSLEVQQNSLQQQRESQIRQGVSTARVDSQIASVKQRLEGRGDDPAVCQVPAISCRAGTFARLENISDALALPGISSSERSQLEQARDQLNTHIQQNCPSGSLSCSNLQDYRDHLSSQKSAESVDQGMLQQEIDGLDRELETQHCSQRTIRPDGTIVHTYSDGRVRIEEPGPPRIVKIGKYNEQGEFVPSSTATFYPNGDESWVIKNPDGSITEREVTKNADGSTETVEVDHDSDGTLTGTRVITEEPQDDGKVKKTTVTRDENGDIVTTSTTTTDPTDHSQVREDVVKDPEVPGQTLHTTTRTNADGSTETRTTIVRPNGSEVVLDPVYVAGECTADKEKLYDEYLSRSQNLFSMASRVQFAQFVKDNADTIERLRTFKTCGELPPINVPCPGNCAENSPAVQELKRMVDTYNNSSDAKFRATMQRGMAEFLTRNSNQSALTQYFACSQGLQAIAGMSPAGFNDPLISQCSQITVLQLPAGLSFTPQSNTRTVITPQGPVTVVTDADGNETTYKNEGTEKIQFSSSDGSGGEITRNSNENSVTTRTRSADGTYTEEVVTYPPGTPVPPAAPGDTGMGPKDADIAVLSTKTTTIRTNGTIEIRETDPTGQTTTHSGTWSESEDPGKINVDITQSKVSGSGPCDACRGLNMDLVNGYHRWQGMFRMLNNGTLGLSDGSKAIPPHDYTSPNSPDQTLPGLNSQIRNAEYDLSAANGALSSARTDAAKAEASQRVRDATRKMNDLQTAANSSYQVARQLHQEYDEWQKNLETLPGGKDDFEKLRKCHELVNSKVCQSPVQCNGDPKCVFGDDRPLENLNLDEYLNSFEGSSSGPGGHYSNGQPRKWIEDPQDREQRLNAEQDETQERPDNVQVTTGENGTSIVRVTNGNTVTTTVEHPDGSITIDTEIRNEEGEVINRDTRYPNGNRETTTTTSSGGVKKTETVLVTPVQVTPVIVYEREDYARPSAHNGVAYKERRVDPVTGQVQQVEGRPETFKDRITVLPDGGMQVTVKDGDGSVLETYVAIALANQELRLRISSPQEVADPCSRIPNVLFYDSYISELLGSRARESNQRLTQTNLERARNGQAGLLPTDYIKDGKVVPAGTAGATPVDANYRPVFDEGQELLQAMQKYHDLLSELQGSLQNSSRTPAQIVRDIEQLFDQYRQPEYFPPLRQIANETNARIRGSDCPDTRYASSVGVIDATRGISSAIGTQTVFVPVDADGRATGSFVTTPSTRTVRMAVPHPEIANPCVYPGDNQAKSKREEILTSLISTGVSRDEAVSQVDTAYAYWKDISGSSEINEGLTESLENFQEAIKGDLANVWQLIKQAHSVTCEGNVFATRAGNLRVDDVPAPSATAPAPGGETRSTIGRVLIQDLKTNVILQPCSFGDALRRLTGLLDTPGVDEALKNTIRQALPGFNDAMALQQGIAQEENQSALRARVQQYYEYLLTHPEVLSLVSGLYKDEIEAKTCSLYALSNYRFGTQETTVGLIAPPKEGETRTVDQLSLEAADPCLRSIPSSKYSGFLNADFDRRVRELRERTRSFDTETINALNEQRWGDIKDPQWQAFHQEYQQMQGALQQYSQLKTELGRASSQENSAVFNDLMRRMEELMRNNRQTDHFPPLLKIIQTGERAELGEGCVTSGESLVMTGSGPIRIKWPTQLLDPTRVCLELGADKLPALMNHLRQRKEQLLQEGGERGPQLVQEVFRRVFNEMVRTGQLTTDESNQLRQELGIRESVDL